MFNYWHEPVEMWHGRETGLLCNAQLDKCMTEALQPAEYAIKLVNVL